MTIPEITITLGWWLIPVSITIFSIVLGVIEEQQNKGSFLHGLGCFVAIAPILGSWLLYFILAYYFGII